jgi:hypothetical protein
MPASLIVAALVSAGAFTATSFAAAAVAFGIRVVTALVVAKIFSKRQDTGRNKESDGSRIQLPPATSNRLPVSYGVAWLRPTITDAKISQDQMTMWYVLPFCEVPSAGSGFGGGTVSFGEIRWGDKRLNFQGDNITVASWTNSAGETDTKPNGLIKVYRYSDGSNVVQPGYSHGSAISILQDNSIAAGQRWASTDLMTKTAFLVIRVDYNQDAGVTGLETITAKITNTLTNPGDVIYDYMINDYYGCGLDYANINVTALQNLAAYSDVMIRFLRANNAGAAYQARYRINGPINTGDDCYSNLQLLAEACDSWIQWNESTAQWGVVINRGYDEAAGSLPAQTVSQLFNITDDNIIGAIQLNPVDLNATYNRIEVTYPDTNIYDSTGFVYVDLDTADCNPNEPDNLLSLNFPVINENVRAIYLATRRLIQSREDLIVSLTMDYSGIQIDAGDVVRINNTKFAWNNKLFRVTQVIEGKNENFLTAQLVLTEYNPQVYENIDITEFIPSPNTGITDPTITSTPIAPTVSNAVPTADIPNFTLNALVPIAGTYSAIEFWYSTYFNSEAIGEYNLLKTILPSDGTVFSNGTTQSYTITGLPASNYFFRVRVVTPAGRKSQFSPASVQLPWTPSVVAPSSIGTNLEWSPSAVTVPCTSAGVPTVLGQTIELYLRVGASVIDVWDGTGTQPNNTWYVGSAATSSGISISALTYNPTTDRVGTTVTGITIEQGTVSFNDIIYKGATGIVYPVGSSGILVTKVRNGTDGAVGNPGAPGNNGRSTRVCYAVIGGLATPANNQIATNGLSSFPSPAEANANWGGSFATTWQQNAPVIGAGQVLFQSNGEYDPVTNNTIWQPPFLSSLRVGDLSAITANIGELNVDGSSGYGSFNMGDIYYTGGTDIDAGRGARLVKYNDGNFWFTLGDAQTNITYATWLNRMYLNGDVVFTENVQPNNITVFPRPIESYPRYPSQTICYPMYDGDGNYIGEGCYDTGETLVYLSNGATYQIPEWISFDTRRQPQRVVVTVLGVANVPGAAANMGIRMFHSPDGGNWYLFHDQNYSCPGTFTTPHTYQAAYQPWYAGANYIRFEVYNDYPGRNTGIQRIFATAMCTLR